MAFHYSPKVVKNGLILYMDPANPNSYPLTGGSNWSDLTTNKNYGSLFGGFIYDSPNMAFSVITATSATDAWITINTPLYFADTSTYSMEFSVRLRPNAEYSYHSLCANNAYAPWTGLYGYGSSWYFFFRGAGGEYSISSTITDYDISQKWATVAFTVAADRTIRFYLNGVFISNTSPSATTTQINLSRIAGGYYGGNGRSYPFQGSISATRIYNRVLTDNELLQNHDTTKTRFGL